LFLVSFLHQVTTKVHYTLYLCGFGVISLSKKSSFSLEVLDIALNFLS